MPGPDADDEVTGANNSYWNFGYDADGERTSSTLGGHVTTFGYDFDGRLTSIAREDGTTTFQYDALGRRQFRTAAGQTTVYTYDGDKPLREYVEQTGGATRSTWGPDGLILRNGPGVHDYPLSDGRGDVRVAADAGENMTAYENPDGVGNGRGSGGQSASLSSPYGWGAGSGYRAGGDGPYGSLALVECGARYYDPETGSFLTRDTDLSQSPYAYCGGDPVNATDPSGHDSESNPPPYQTPDPAVGDGTDNGGGSGSDDSSDSLPPLVSAPPTSYNPPFTLSIPPPTYDLSGFSLGNSGASDMLLTPSLNASNKSDGTFTLGAGATLEFGNGYKVTASYGLSGKDGIISGNNAQINLIFPPIHIRH